LRHGETFACKFAPQPPRCKSAGYLAGSKPGEAAVSFPLFQVRQTLTNGYSVSLKTPKSMLLSYPVWAKRPFTVAATFSGRVFMGRLPAEPKRSFI